MRKREHGDEPEMSVERAKEGTAAPGDNVRSADGADVNQLSLRVLHALLEQMPLGAMIVSAPAGQLLAANAEIERILGVHLPTVASASAFVDRRLGVTSGQPDYHIIHQTLTRGTSLVDAPVQFVRGDESVIEMMLSCEPVRDQDGSIAAAVVTCREARSGIETNQSAAIWVRADLFATLTLLARDRVRDSFLSTAAHELRTPLTTISGFSQLLERQLQKPNLDRERLTTLMLELRQQVARMTTLADDLMRAVSLHEMKDAGEEQVCDVVSIAQAAVDRAQLSVEFTSRHQIRIDAGEEVAAVCNPEHLDQMFTNLLSNALKYSPEGGRVTVRLIRSGKHVAVAVQDEGIGLSLEDQRRLWQPFLRFGPLRQSAGGTGLGLYIVRHLVEQNGGAVAVESMVGAGSTFTITLPAWPLLHDGHSPA